MNAFRFLGLLDDSKIIRCTSWINLLQQAFEHKWKEPLKQSSFVEILPALESLFQGRDQQLNQLIFATLHW